MKASPAGRTDSKVLAVLRTLKYPLMRGLLVALMAATACTGLPPSAPDTGRNVTPVADGPAGPPAARSNLPGDPGSVKFLVIGDSGTGDRAQFEVAARIAAAHQVFPFDRAIMLGDNLYGRNNAAAYRNKFERPYAPLLEAGVKFYASLGNHDDPAQRFYKPFNMDERRYYTHSKGDVRFFALDSTYMTPEQLRWVEDELRKSTEKWKIAYMHHPMYSSGERHGPTPALRKALEPLFLRYGVDVVFAGHEHFYERLHPQSGITYVIQGGAAKLRRGNIRPSSEFTAKGFDTDRSFTLAEVVDDQMYLETISRMGTIVDSTVIVRREVSASSSE